MQDSDNNHGPGKDYICPALIQAWSFHSFANGHGLHSCKKIFEPFVSGRVGGSGLGLAIVQRAVLAHHGVVFFDSEPNVGTSFTVLLPCRRQTEADQ